ncbi:MAG: PspA/IM30 family protein [Firmicutes bacterium]|nr:PspA/IM30 family protein [Bacillota bacterium]
MGILSRVSDILSANVNALIDKCENPEKMVDQYLRSAMEDLAEVKKETASVMAEETKAKRALDDASEKIAHYQDLTKKAIAAGNDGDAKIFITKKQEIEAGLVTLQKTYDTAHLNAENMRKMHDKLTNDIAALKIRRDNVKGQMSVAKTQQKVNKMSEMSDKIGGTMGAFAAMEEKAQRELDEANAMSELNTSPEDEAATAEARYSGINSQSVDDELARIKAEMGL